MFGIFTPAELHCERFWYNLSQKLQKQGSDYIERCIFWNKPLSTGDNLILPAKFPPLPCQVKVPPQCTPLVGASKEDVKDVSEIGAFQKSMTKRAFTDQFHAVRPRRYY